MSTPRFGSHDLKAGFENFQSRSSAVTRRPRPDTSSGVITLCRAAAPALDAEGRVVPVFTPGTSASRTGWPRAARRSTSPRTPFYVHDRWTATGRLTLDLGSASRSSTARPPATSQPWTRNDCPPAGRRVRRDGKRPLDCAGRVQSLRRQLHRGDLRRNTDVANPSQVTYGYTGPAGQGVTFAPGFDLANYSTLIGGNFPTANVFFEDGAALAALEGVHGRPGDILGRRSSFRAMYQWRSIGGFLEASSTIRRPRARPRDRGMASPSARSTTSCRRNSDLPTREYQALVFQGSQRLSNRWIVDGHWTVQLRNNGTFEGEAAAQPGIPTIIGDYPEFYDLERSNPDGRLNDFQRSSCVCGRPIRWGSAGQATSTPDSSIATTPPLTYSLFASGVDRSAIPDGSQSRLRELACVADRVLSPSVGLRSSTARSSWTWPSRTAFRSSANCGRG